MCLIKFLLLPFAVFLFIVSLFIVLSANCSECIYGFENFLSFIYYDLNHFSFVLFFIFPLQEIEELASSSEGFSPYKTLLWIRLGERLHKKFLMVEKVRNQYPQKVCGIVFYRMNYCYSFTIFVYFYCL